MSLAQDLMEQAEDLAKRERTRPRQASLRRAVSASYYALFHLLNSASAATIAPNVTTEVNFRIRRWFDHGEMKKVCGRFLPAQLSEPLLGLLGTSASPQLQRVALAFIQLQDARHSADYDLGWWITRSDAFQYIGLASDAFEAWCEIEDTSEANIFILSLLLWKNWERDR